LSHIEHSEVVKIYQNITPQKDTFLVWSWQQDRTNKL